MEKLYGLYCVISNKTIRKNEKKYIRFKSANNLPGTLVLTNRGYFIDGHEVDKKSVELYNPVQNELRRKKILNKVKR